MPMLACGESLGWVYFGMFEWIQIVKDRWAAHMTSMCKVKSR